MKLLLDSHTLLWHALNAPQLSATASAAIQDPANEVWISPASLWELAIKVSIGKLTVQQPFERFAQACEQRFPLLAVSAAHTAQVASLPFPTDHRDPFDRLIIAQAVVESMSVVSADEAFDSYPVNRMW